MDVQCDINDFQYYTSLSLSLSLSLCFSITSLATSPRKTSFVAMCNKSRYVDMSANIQCILCRCRYLQCHQFMIFREAPSWSQNFYTKPFVVLKSKYLNRIRIELFQIRIGMLSQVHFCLFNSTHSMRLCQSGLYAQNKPEH